MDENNQLHRSDATFLERLDRMLCRLEEKVEILDHSVREKLPHQLAQMEKRIMGNLDNIKASVATIASDFGSLSDDLGSINTDLTAIAQKLNSGDGISADDAAALAAQLQQIASTADTAKSGVDSVKAQMDTLAGTSSGNAPA